MIALFKRLKLLTLLLVYFCLAFPKMVYAYLDPGTGSYILQLLIAGLLGTTFLVKTFWHNIKSFFANLFAKESKDAQNTQK